MRALIVLIYLLGGLTLSSWANELSLERSQIVGKLESTYHIKLSYIAPPPATWSKVSFDAISSQERDGREFMGYLRILQEELSKYPPDFIQAIGLEGIALVKNLKYDGQIRAALPDFSQEILYLDAYEGGTRLIYRRHVIHHELYHMIEEQLNGHVRYKDPNWEKLNTPNFTYGLGGEYYRGRDMFPFVHPQMGFVNRYSTTALEEDKAEIFAALFIPEEAKRIQEWSKEDQVLKAKVDYIKAFVAKYSAIMDEEFWKQFL